MLKFIGKKKLAGFTLAEILVALTINAFLLTAIVATFGTNIGHYRRTLDAMRLQQQLQSALSIMSNEIRRAGYWGNAKNDLGGTATNNNPFMQAVTDITIVGGNCIIFTYDHDKNGTIPASPDSSIDDEYYGFRLSGTSLQARPAGAPIGCGALPNTWESMLDDNTIQVTALTFTPTFKTVTTGPGTKSLTTRAITISITGNVASDATITKTLTQYVKVRNDKVWP